MQPLTDWSVAGRLSSDVWPHAETSKVTDGDPGKNWKLDLRYGRLSTPFRHFTLVADGLAGDLEEGFSCRSGPAVMAMKAWASDTDEAADMAISIGRQIGFSVSGRIEVFETDAEQPPGQNPYGYAIVFTPYEDA